MVEMNDAQKVVLIAREVLSDAIQGIPYAQIIIEQALLKAQEVILEVVSNHELSFCDPLTGEHHRITLETMPDNVQTSTVFMVMTAWAWLCDSGENSFTITTNDILTLISYLSTQDKCQFHPKWPFKKSEIRHAWKKTTLT